MRYLCTQHQLTAFELRCRVIIVVTLLTILLLPFSSQAPQNTTIYGANIQPPAHNVNNTDLRRPYRYQYICYDPENSQPLVYTDCRAAAHSFEVDNQPADEPWALNPSTMNSPPSIMSQDDHT